MIPHRNRDIFSDHKEFPGSALESDSLRDRGDAPQWQREQEGNEFITSGYRSAAGSVGECVASLGQVHNELVSAHVHLLAALLFVGLPLYVYLYGGAESRGVAEMVIGNAESWVDVAVPALFFPGVSLAFALSAGRHIISNHHDPAFHETATARLDGSAGILLFWTSALPSIFYIFRHEPELRTNYAVGYTALATVCTALVVLHKGFHRPGNRHWLGAIYATLLLAGAGTLWHGGFFAEWQMEGDQMRSTWFESSAVLYSVGLIFSRAKIPERLAPGKFDDWGASHQILHVAMVVASITYMVGLTKAYESMNAAGYARKVSQ